MSAPTITAPKNMTYETAMKNADIGLGSANAQSAINNGMWGSVIGGVGNTLANKDVQAGIKDWWSGLGGSGSTPSAGSSTGIYDW